MRENTQLRKLLEENAQLKMLQEENEKLKKELAARANNSNKRAGATTTEARIPRPAGPVSKWSLQKEMGLEGSVEKRKMYEAIQVCTHFSLVAKPIVHLHPSDPFVRR